MRYLMIVLLSLLLCASSGNVFAERPDFPLPVMGGEELKCSQQWNTSCKDGCSHFSYETYNLAWDFNMYGEYGDNDKGLPVVSTVDGRVVYATDPKPYEVDGWGKCIAISCDWCSQQGGAVLVGHLDQILVKPGEMVKRGQVIGLLGNADGKYAGGAHIHYQYQIATAESYNDITGNPLLDSHPNSQSQESELVYKETSHTSEAKKGTLANIYDKDGKLIKLYCDDDSTVKFISTNNQIIDLRHCQNTWLNPYSGHTSDHLPCNVFGSPKPLDNGRLIHWWHPTSFGPDYRSTMYDVNGIPKNCYIQEYTGKKSGAPWNGAVVYDALGGARRAYVVGWWQWEAWHVMDSPNDNNSTFDSGEGGPNSHCGMPITDSYGLANGEWRQDFQKCFLIHERQYFWPSVAPGWFEDAPHWRPEMSYLFAESYERNGASIRVGVPTSANPSGKSGVHEWWFNGNADFVWAQDVAGGSNAPGIIIYDPDNFDPNNLAETHLATNQAYYLYGEVWEMFKKMDGPGGALGPPTTDRMYQNGSNDHFIQYFRDGLYENKKGKVSVANYASCVLATDEENFWASNHNVCNGSDQGGDPGNESESCYPNVLFDQGQLIQWEDSDGVTAPYVYVFYGSQLYFLTSEPMVTAWGGKESSQVVSRCLVDSMKPISVDEFHDASFPEDSVVHYVDQGAIFVLQKKEWHHFPTWEDYVWFQNHWGIKNTWIDVGWYEMSMFPEGVPYVRPPFECPQTPKHPNFTILQWMSDDETTTQPWYYLVYGDFLVYLTDSAMLEAWGGQNKAIPTHQCVLDRMGPISADNLVEATFPEGTVAVHTSNGRVLAKIHNQWRYVSDPETLNYYTTFLNLSARHIPAGDYAVSRLPEGAPLKKPKTCQLPFPLKHGQLVRKQGDDGTPWPYVYVLYHQQLVYLSTDPMLNSYGGLPQATLLNWCVVDQLQPKHVSDMPQASFPEKAVIRHVPTGGIFVRDLYRWHAFPTWDDYVWYQNNQGVASSWIDIGDYELYLVPLGNPWYAPASSSSSAAPFEAPPEEPPPPDPWLPRFPHILDQIRIRFSDK